MTEEERVAVCLHKFCEQFIYSSSETCKRFAYLGSKKCRQILKERYGIVLKERVRWHENELSPEEQKQLQEDRRARRREYYHQHQEHIRAYARKRRELERTWCKSANLLRAAGYSNSQQNAAGM